MRRALSPTPDRIMHGLYLGGKPAAENQHELQKLGIRHVIQISGKKRENPFPDLFQYSTFVFADSNAVDIALYLDKAVGLIAAAVNKAEPILVHCDAGMSRSATFVLAYLIKVWKMTLS
jgi:protein tyrosine phosphatase